MDLTELGSFGYQIGGLGILAFTLVFLISVRWTSDLLGKVLGAVFITISAIFLTGGYRLIYDGDSEWFLLWRAFLYTSFGVVVWGAFFAFIWSQFFAPRIKARTTRRSNEREEANVAGSRPDRHGDSHDRSGCHS